MIGGYLQIGLLKTLPERKRDSIQLGKEENDFGGRGLLTELYKVAGMLFGSLANRLGEGMVDFLIQCQGAGVKRSFFITAVLRGEKN